LALRSDDDSIFDDEARDPVGELQELAQEVMEQDDPRDTSGNLAASGAAMLVIGVVAGAGGAWLLRAWTRFTNLDIVGHDGRHPYRDHQHPWWLLGLGVAVSFVAAVFLIFALVSFAKIALRRTSRGSSSA
jgi:hypothetical protein